MDKVLVLNSDYTPLNVTSIRRGFKLVYKGKAEILTSDSNPIVTAYREYVRPVIIRLLNYVKHVVKKLRVNRKRIYERDHHKCGYCGSTRSLTIDHILPKSRGGGNSWTNLVTCCHPCNLKKADRTPEEARMQLLVRPYEPSVQGKLVEGTLQQVWIEYQQSFC